MAVTTAGASGTVAIAGGAYDTYDTVEAHIYRFDVVLGNDEYESTNFRDTANTDGKTFEMGLFQARGTLSAFLDDVSMVALGRHAPLAVSATALTLTIVTGETFAFPAQLFNIRMGVNRQTGLSTLDCDFVSDGDLTVT